MELHELLRKPVEGETLDGELKILQEVLMKEFEGSLELHNQPTAKLLVRATTVLLLASDFHENVWAQEKFKFYINLCLRYMGL